MATCDSLLVCFFIFPLTLALCKASMYTSWRKILCNGWYLVIFLLLCINSQPNQRLNVYPNQNHFKASYHLPSSLFSLALLYPIVKAAVLVFRASEKMAEFQVESVIPVLWFPECRSNHASPASGCPGRCRCPHPHTIPLLPHHIQGSTLALRRTHSSQYLYHLAYFLAYTRCLVSICWIYKKKRYSP